MSAYIKFITVNKLLIIISKMKFINLMHIKSKNK